ncbi:hypothetical protein L6R46_29865, partial [Myxococcota bacterium]|nr:hypothetical protein [Myxococcota bacterium]
MKQGRLSGADRPGVERRLNRRQGRPGRDHLLGEYQELFGILDGRWRYHWCAEGGAELLFDLQ